MSDYTICNLYSGSGGNCTYIAGAHTRILIDAGKSARSLSAALTGIGADIAAIDAIFITHEHTDHISALETLSKKHHIPIHAVEGCARSIARTAPTAAACTVSHAPDYTVVLGDLTISSFRTSHDSACPVGYRIETPTGEAFGVATDTGIVTVACARALTGCCGVVLECNHDPEILQNGIYPPSLKARISSRFGHLSNPDCARFARYLVDHGTRSLLLAHLSEENNRPDAAMTAVRDAVNDPHVFLTVARPDAPTFLSL